MVGTSLEKTVKQAIFYAIKKLTLASVKGFIALYGELNTGKFQAVIIFITKTETRTIMKSVIWKCFLQAIMNVYTGNCSQKKNGKNDEKT